MHFRLAAITCLALAFASSDAIAQRFIVRLPRVQKNEFGIGIRVMAPVTVNFETDGFINPDLTDGFFSNGSVLSDGLDNPDGTRNWTYLSGSQIVSLGPDGQPIPDFYNGQYVRMTEVTGSPAEGTFTSPNDDSSPSFGWEAHYVRYLNEKKKLGLFMGFGVNGIDTSSQRTWGIRETRHDWYYGIDENFPRNQNGGAGTISNNDNPVPGDRPPGLVTKDPIFGPVVTETPLITDASGSWELDAGLYTFRLGAIYNLDLTRRLNMRVGAGFAAIFIDSEYSWREGFTPRSIEGEPKATVIGYTSSDKEFLLGGWADVGAHYRINQRVTFFSTFEYQSTSNFTHDSQYDRAAEIETDAMMSARTGFTWAF